MLSIFYDDTNVYYNFDELLQIMVQLNFETVDKKTLSPAHVYVKPRNAQVFVTDGINMAARVIDHDECYIEMEGVLHIIKNSAFGDCSSMEKVLCRATKCVLKYDHPWQKKFRCFVQQRVQTSFDVYMKVCRQYFICGKPESARIGVSVDTLIQEASRLQHSDEFEDIISSYVMYDKATRLVLGTL